MVGDNAYKLLGIIQSHAPTQKEQRMITCIYQNGPEEGKEKAMAGILYDGLAYGNWPWSPKTMSERRAVRLRQEASRGAPLNKSMLRMLQSASEAGEIRAMVGERGIARKTEARLLGAGLVVRMSVNHSLWITGAGRLAVHKAHGMVPDYVECWTCRGSVAETGLRPPAGGAPL